ncbi:DUF2065 domain-containing protein [Halorhodospira abdelmalekii]|uniref:DUF2065 domain-containing protein n=1 Tax=Halorhodospira abdelmalekii TaxID=421629 RepID=UPI001906DF56|nr:DUF2065 domain-containing protein [Halorhodospira abdelmalekii]MBK1734819.1 DUF2065 domain-containing protein [Halorhodospira abdelmalekii]
MAIQDLLTAVALLLVLEGIMPAASPGMFREAMRQAAEMDDGSLRAIGLVAMGLGVLLLYLVRS